MHTLVRFPSAVRTRCKLPFALRLGLSQEDTAYQGITNERQNKEQRNAGPHVLFPFCRGHEGECGMDERSLFISGTQPLASSPRLFPSAPGDPILLSRDWDPPPTSVVERKSKNDCTSAHSIFSAFRSRAVLEEVLPCLSPVRAPPAPSGGSTLHAAQVLPGEAEPRLRLVYL